MQIRKIFYWLLCFPCSYSFTDGFVFYVIVIIENYTAVDLTTLFTVTCNINLIMFYIYTVVTHPQKLFCGSFLLRYADNENLLDLQNITNFVIYTKPQISYQTWNSTYSSAFLFNPTVGIINDEYSTQLNFVLTLDIRSSKVFIES